MDARRAKPSQLLTLVNSTPLGPVLSEPELRKHRQAAGTQIGDGATVDVLRYLAWHVRRRHSNGERGASAPRSLDGSPAAQAQQGADAPRSPGAERPNYDRIKEAARERNARLSRSGRDIAPLPAPADPARRAAAIASFRLFCEVYFPETFQLAWSADHLRVIARLEAAARDGGLFALAMPRHSGKSSLCEAACQWAILGGYRQFVVLVGATEAHAEESLDSIKTELEANDLLAADFPEVCYPIAALGGIANRCAGQLCDGERTAIGWTAKEIIFPTVAGSAAAGARIRVAGITGRIRGMKGKNRSGQTVRPDLVVIDDPQTDESARSPVQSQTRLRTLMGAILGLSGPGKKISGIMPCTVIARRDMADEILDRDKNPVWQGERLKMVYSFPTDEKLWGEYGRLRAEELRHGGDGSQATAFYAEHRQAMDAGGVVAWPEDFEPGELSALQHAMNIMIDRPTAFWAECQSEPLDDAPSEISALDPVTLAHKTSGLPRGIVPPPASLLTAFVDVQKPGLPWLVAAWWEGFQGQIIDYGFFPDPGLPYWQKSQLKRTLADVAPGAGLEGQLFAGLKAVTDAILGRAWLRPDGTQLRVERLMIDANWGLSTATVYEFIRQSPHAALLLPSHGKFIGATSTPFNQYRKKPGERLGLHWLIPASGGRRGTRHVLIDTNHWKSFCTDRLGLAQGDRGSWTLFGGQRPDHRLLADHLTAEYRTRVEAKGRVVDEWKIKPSRPDNDWFDCLVGAAVAASICGLSPTELAAAPFSTQKPLAPPRSVGGKKSFAEKLAAAKKRS